MSNESKDFNHDNNGGDEHDVSASDDSILTGDLVGEGEPDPFAGCSEEDFARMAAEFSEEISKPHDVQSVGQVAVIPENVEPPRILMYGPEDELVARLCKTMEDVGADDYEIYMVQRAFDLANTSMAAIQDRNSPEALMNGVKKAGELLDVGLMALQSNKREDQTDADIERLSFMLKGAIDERMQRISELDNNDMTPGPSLGGMLSGLMGGSKPKAYASSEKINRKIASLREFGGNLAWEKKDGKAAMEAFKVTSKWIKDASHRIPGGNKADAGRRYGEYAQHLEMIMQSERMKAAAAAIRQMVIRLMNAITAKFSRHAGPKM